jgi:MFS transporter, UMF1 family
MMEQSAREMGVLRHDPSQKCHSSSEKVSAPASNATALLSARETKAHSNQCVVHIFGSEVNTASFAMYTFAMAVLVQAITLVSISAIADHGA